MTIFQTADTAVIEVTSGDTPTLNYDVFNEDGSPAILLNTEIQFGAGTPNIFFKSIATGGVSVVTSSTGIDNAACAITLKEEDTLTASPGIFPSSLVLITSGGSRYTIARDLLKILTAIVPG